MKVKVSYTVDLDKVPDLIAQVLEDCSTSLSDHARGLKFRPHDHEASIKSIQDVRLSLASIDESLQEASHLMAGWHNAVSAPKHAPPPIEDAPPLDPPDQGRESYEVQDE